jgi:hypothetical protein
VKPCTNDGYDFLSRESLERLRMEERVRTHYAGDGCTPPHPTVETATVAQKIVKQKFKGPVRATKPQAIKSDDKTLAGIHKRVMLGEATQEDAQALLHAINDVKKLIAASHEPDASFQGVLEFVLPDDLEEIFENIGKDPK